MTKAFIFVSGTDMDSDCPNETVTKLLRRAQNQGYLAKDIAGPGSLQGSKQDANHFWYGANAQNYVPAKSLTQLSFKMLGTAGGYGVKNRIAKEIRETMFDYFDNHNIQTLEIVGFSRGAVAIARAMSDMQQEFPNHPKLQSKTIKLHLLDPVPGPWPQPQQINIPKWVTSVNLLTAIHEGRPCFAQLNLNVQSPTKLSGEMRIGVHGDIGGSTVSDAAWTVEYEMAELLGLQDAISSKDEQMYHHIKTMVEWYKLNNRFEHQFWPRSFADGEGGKWAREDGDLRTPDWFAGSKSGWQMMEQFQLMQLMMASQNRDRLENDINDAVQRFSWDPAMFEKMWRDRAKFPTNICVPQGFNHTATGDVWWNKPQVHTLPPVSGSMPQAMRNMMGMMQLDPKVAARKVVTRGKG